VRWYESPDGRIFEAIRAAYGIETSNKAAAESPDVVYLAARRALRSDRDYECEDFVPLPQLTA
jgi:hypothetical protein